MQGGARDPVEVGLEDAMRALNGWAAFNFVPKRADVQSIHVSSMDPLAEFYPSLPSFYIYHIFRYLQKCRESQRALSISE